MHALSHIDSVLIIEDEYFIASELAETFSRHGVPTVEIAAGIAQCLALLEQKAIDFATVDVNLRDGWCEELVEELAARSIPFVYVSGYAPEDRPGLRRAAWIRKPVDEQELLAAILAARPAKATSAGQSEDSSPAL
ncbi:response regulator [Devosia albogilva]|uniref:Response regulator n=1 Tax=Devosia albogilva TaxID=429726 RepID=A0ABW5QIU0_9HYPH